MPRPRRLRPISVAISGPDAQGRYYAYVTVGTKPDGTRDRRRRSGATPEEVERKIRDLEDQVARGDLNRAGTGDTLADWLEYYLEHIVRPRLRRNTYDSYRPIIKLHLIPRLGGWRLRGPKQLEPEHVEAAYTSMRDAGMSRAYVRQCHAVLSKALKTACARGRATRNVCLLVDPPPLGSQRIKPFSLEEVTAVMEAIRGTPLEARWLLGICQGMRQGECLGLRWDAVDLDAEEITVELQAQRYTWEHGCRDPQACARPHCRTKPCSQKWEHGCGGGCGKTLAYACPSRVAVPGCRRHRGMNGCPPPCAPGCTRHASTCPQRHGGGVVLHDPKTRRGIRTMALMPGVAPALREHKRRQAEQRMAAGPAWEDYGLVFCSALGRPLDPRRDHEAWEQVLRSAGVRDGRLHAARHTAGTMLLATGTDIRVVQSILGHTDIRMTERYTEASTQLQKEAFARLAAAVMATTAATTNRR